MSAALLALQYDLEALRSENATLRKELKRLDKEINSACDAVWERDQKIATLQEMLNRAHAEVA